MHAHPDYILRFDNLAQLGMHCISNGIGNRDASLKWTGNIDAGRAAHLAMTGDDSQVSKAQRLLDQFSQNIETYTMQDVPSVAGCYPCIPDALMGEPECMRMPELTAHTSAPLNILVDIASSAKLNAQFIQRRGVAILALVMALSAVRPVTLEIMTVMGRHGSPNQQGDQFSIITAKLNTAPLDLASAAYALTHVGLPRQLFHGLAFAYHDFNGHFALFDGVLAPRLTQAQYAEKITQYLGKDSDTFVIPAATTYSALLMQDPEAWVRQQLDIFGQRDHA